MNKEESTLKKDLVGSVIIGFAAAALSLIVINNLSIPIANWVPFIVFPFLTISGILVGRFLGNKLPILYKFVKFGEAGGLNWLVDFGVLNLLILVTGISSGIYYSVFKGASFVVATGNSYAWNKKWVFESKEKKVGGELTRFLIITVLGMALNVLIATSIVFFGPKVFEGIDSKVWANLAAAIGSLLAMAWNFIMYKFWVFK